MQTPYVSQVPIRCIDVESPENVSRYSQMVELVETMLDLNKRLAEAQTARDKTPRTYHLPTHAAQCAARSTGWSTRSTG